MLVTNIIRQLEKHHPTTKFKIHYADLPTVKTNPVVLEYVFKELLENGIKFNQQPTPTLHIRYLQKRHRHCFEFQDNGIGIDSKFQHLIFEMFKRLNTRDHFEGAGLGLCIVKKMLEKIGGTIQLSASTPKEGSKFLVSLPKIQPIPSPNIKTELSIHSSVSV